jgi:hypothetical protein
VELIAGIGKADTYHQYHLCVLVIVMVMPAEESLFCDDCPTLVPLLVEILRDSQPSNPPQTCLPAAVAVISANDSGWAIRLQDSVDCSALLRKGDACCCCFSPPCCR